MMGLTSLTRVACNLSASKILTSATTGPASEWRRRGAFSVSEPLPSLRRTTGTPRQHQKVQDVGRILQYPSILRTSRKALQTEEQLQLLTQAPPAQQFEAAVQIPEELEGLLVLQDLVPRVKEDLICIRNSQGEVSVSAYDTAWVARIPNANGLSGPHFPQTLEWILANQHPDGSWGDSQMEWLFDRFIQTLASVVALKSWNRYPSCVQRGVEYIRRTAGKLEECEMVTMPIGFEMSVTGLLADSKALGLDLPYDTPFFRVIEQLRDKKLQRIPLELLHSRPTTILHTLEGLQSLDIDWDKVLKFRGEDGSMCCSPSATVALYMHTGDKKCLAFLENTLRKFNNAVPTCYPMDTFHNLWVVDTLERLGISRYFKADVDLILSTVYREWTKSDNHGICWAKVLEGIPDLDDTSMAFRLLRQHGYDVSSEAFKDFRKGGAFVCFNVGQLVQGVSDMFNLFRACETAYPGEELLAKAESFSRAFLVDALRKNKGDADKWSLKKDITGELNYHLRNPEYKSLNRMRVRDYLDRYGADDAWIGKSIYRLRIVNNWNYLKLAKADFNLCQTLHQKELHEILRWISYSGLADSSTVQDRITLAFAMFSAELWEPELSAVRIAAGKCMFIATALKRNFYVHSSLADLKQLVAAIRIWDPSRVQKLPEKLGSCFMVLYNTINETRQKSTDQSGLHRQLVHIWERLLSSFLVDSEWRAQNRGATDESRTIAMTANRLKAITLSLILLSGEIKDPYFVTWMEKDSALLRTASEAVRVAVLQGMASTKETSIMSDEQSHSMLVKKEIYKEINFQLGQMSTVPLIVKRVLISFTKAANCYYDRDAEQFDYLKF